MSHPSDGHVDDQTHFGCLHFVGPADRPGAKEAGSGTLQPTQSNTGHTWNPEEPWPRRLEILGSVVFGTRRSADRVFPLVGVTACRTRQQPRGMPRRTRKWSIRSRSANGSDVLRPSFSDARRE